MYFPSAVRIGMIDGFTRPVLHLRRYMMRTAGLLSAAALVLTGASALWAAELTSGIPVGGFMPRYMAIKCGGGNDGIDLGTSLCYT